MILWLALVFVTVPATACATTPDPPEAPADPPPPASLTPEPIDGPTARQLPARPYPVPPRLWVEPRPELSPSEPRAGTALAIALALPCLARQPVEVEGSYGDQTVHFGRLGSRWFGLTALPPDESGAGTLLLRYRLASDSTVVARRRIFVRERTYPAARLSVSPRFTSPPASVQARIERERRLVSRTLDRRTPEWLLTDDVRWPRPSQVTSPFGQRRVFNGELQSRHWGVDLRGRQGEPVRAAARGRAALVRDLYFAGRAVYLDHGRGVYTGYFHLSRAEVQEGDLVEPGQVIGQVGSSGRVTGPHLHWALYVNGIHVDARSLFSLEIPARAATEGDAEAGVRSGPDPSGDARAGRRAACPG